MITGTILACFLSIVNGQPDHDGIKNCSDNVVWTLNAQKPFNSVEECQASSDGFSNLLATNPALQSRAGVPETPEGSIPAFFGVCKDENGNVVYDGSKQ